jgi:mRNA interferase MazF
MENLKRGDVVTIAGGAGDYGSKLRPAIIIQSDIFNALQSIAVLPLTSHLADAPIFRVVIEPTINNGFPDFLKS